MFKQTKSFPFPRVYGFLDDASDDLNTVRNLLSTKNAVRFIEDPSILIKYPIVKNQITVGIIDEQNYSIWDEIKGKVNMNLILTRNGWDNVPSNLSRMVISQNTIELSSKNMKTDDLVLRMAYLISITHLVVPKNRRIANNFINVCDPSIFNKTIWITNIFKNKNYQDRKMILTNLRKTIEQPEDSRSYDEMVIFGEEDYLTKINTDKSYVKKQIVNTITGVQTIGEMFRWVFKTYPKGTVVILVRQEATELSFSSIRSVSRMNTRSISCINPFVLPDIPDPKPELYQRGDPRAICGYAIKLDNDTTIPVGTNLDQCSLYSVNHHEIVMGEMMMRRYNTGNGSRQIGVCFPNLNKFVLEQGKVRPSSGVICPEQPPLSYFQSTTDCPGEKVYSIDCTGFDYDPLPGINNDCPLETKTLLNMTNKTSMRNKHNKYCMLNDSKMSYPSQSYNLYNAECLRFKRNYWVENKKMVSQDYWGNGVRTKDTGFVHRSEVLKDCTIIPRTSDTIIDRACMIIGLENTSFAKTMVLDIDPQEVHFFKKLNPNLHYRQFQHHNLFGDKGSVFVKSPGVSKDLGFSPVIVRKMNQKYHEKANVDIQTMRMLGETNGLIVMSKWSKSVHDIVNELYPSIKWKIVDNLESVDPGAFANASFVIGMQDAGSWVGSMFVHPDHCKIIEIAYEHDTTSKWYHLTRGVGAKYSIIPLKNEPKNRCLQRIKDNLKYYLNE